VELILFESNSVTPGVFDGIHDTALSLCDALILLLESVVTILFYLNWALGNLNMTIFNIDFTSVYTSCVSNTGLECVLNGESFSSLVRLFEWHSSGVGVTIFVFPHFLSADFAIISSNYSSSDVMALTRHARS